MAMLNNQMVAIEDTPVSSLMTTHHSYFVIFQFVMVIRLPEGKSSQIFPQFKQFHC
jgi:hypothetical protein